MSRKKIQKWLQDAVAAHQQGDLAQADSLYRKVLKTDARNADALHLSGLIAYQSQRLDEALDLVNRAIKSNNSEASFWNTLGLIRRAQGNLAAAISSYEKAAQLSPRHLDAWTNMGTAWHYAGDKEQAQACYEKALAINPAHITALKHLGQIHSEKKNYPEAESLFERVLAIAPQDIETTGFLVFARKSLCKWEDLDTLQELIQQRVRSGETAFITPWSYLSISSSPEDQLYCAKAWAERVMTPMEQQSGSRVLRQPSNEGPIRIAYWSADLQEHAVSHLLAEVIELHDRSDVEITLLSYGSDDGSAMRRRLVDAADHFLDIQNTSFAEVVELLQERKIDILVDLMGYTANTRSHMLALRPSPIQVNWLGYAGTMGTRHVDYIIADEFVIPNDAEMFYTEKVIRLPHCFMPNDRKREVAAPKPRIEYGLPEKGIVFCSFNQGYKIQPEIFDSWMRILNQVPDSILWLLSSSEEMENNLRREAKSRGIAAERLVFASSKVRLPLPEYLARYRVADIALDTYPYSSHATASDALWAGCPLVALTGDTFASRVSGSLLHALGMPELVASNLQEFEEIAVALALEPDKLAATTQRLEELRTSAPLFDAPHFTRGLEEAYRQMVEEKRTELDM